MKNIKNVGNILSTGFYLRQFRKCNQWAKRRPYWPNPPLYLFVFLTFYSFAVKFFQALFRHSLPTTSHSENKIDVATFPFSPLLFRDFMGVGVEPCIFIVFSIYTFKNRVSF